MKIKPGKALFLGLNTIIYVVGVPLLFRSNQWSNLRLPKHWLLGIPSPNHSLIFSIVMGSCEKRFYLIHIYPIYIHFELFQLIWNTRFPI